MDILIVIWSRIVMVMAMDSHGWSWRVMVKAMDVLIIHSKFLESKIKNWIFDVPNPVRLSILQKPFILTFSKKGRTQNQNYGW